MSTARKTREQLMSEALYRIAVVWPGIDRAKEAAAMAGFSDLQLAICYMPARTSDSYFSQAAQIYGSDDVGGLYDMTSSTD